MMNECTPIEAQKMQSGQGRFVNRPGYSKKKEYPKFFIYVPIEVARDTSFPFVEGEKVVVKIDGKRLIVEKT